MDNRQAAVQASVERRFPKPIAYNEPPQVEGINGIGVVWLTQGKRTLPPHQHDVSHLGVVLTGAAKVRIGEDVQELSAPAIIDLPANIEHEAWAISEEALWLSVFPKLMKETYVATTHR
jgi:quercetin dioxygenase-like cupin family protein